MVSLQWFGDARRTPSFNHFDTGQACVELAKSLAPVFNKLVHKICEDTKFLLQVHEHVPDDFTQRLAKIVKTIAEEGGDPQKIQMGIFRSDYMLHESCKLRPSEAVIQQVEINTISASFASLSFFTHNLHKYVIERGWVPGLTREDLAGHESLLRVCSGLHEAWTLYGNKEAVVVMVVDPNENNTSDQRHIEYFLWNRFNVKMVRRSLHDIGERGSLNPTTKAITIDGLEAAIFYLRSGYAPQDHPSELEWSARLLMEQSLAIVCPNIRYHLCGTKKMQQVWAIPGILEKYLTAEECALLRRCFVGLYSLDSRDNPQEIIDKVLKDPVSYVMKPQREGGGNLLYKEKMVEALTTMDEEERSAYVLMDRICPPSEETYFFTKGIVTILPGVSELGAYSVILADKEKEYVSECAGLLLRTKAEGVEDGGVCSGVAFLNSIALI